MVEFLRKLENRDIKILGLTRFLSPHLTLIYCILIYFNFVRCWGVGCDVDIFKLTAVLSQLVEKSMVRR